VLDAAGGHVRRDNPGSVHITTLQNFRGPLIRYDSETSPRSLPGAALVDGAAAVDTGLTKSRRGFHLIRAEPRGRLLRLVSPQAVSTAQSPATSAAPGSERERC